MALFRGFPEMRQAQPFEFRYSVYTSAPLAGLVPTHDMLLRLAWAATPFGIRNELRVWAIAGSSGMFDGCKGTQGIERHHRQMKLVSLGCCW